MRPPHTASFSVLTKATMHKLFTKQKRALQFILKCPFYKSPKQFTSLLLRWRSRQPLVLCQTRKALMPPQIR